MQIFLIILFYPETETTLQKLQSGGDFFKFYVLFKMFFFLSWWEWNTTIYNFKIVDMINRMYFKKARNDSSWSRNYLQKFIDVNY